MLKIIKSLLEKVINDIKTNAYVENERELRNVEFSD